MYAYVNATNKIKAFMEKIQDVGVPAKVTQTWLALLGFRSTNDRSLIAMLKQIKFVDASGQPTKYWEEYRAGDRRMLALAIREGYPAFFETYSDAQRRSSAELENLVKVGNARINQDTVRRVVSTFRALVGEADFDNLGSEPRPSATTTANGSGNLGTTVQSQETFTPTVVGARVLGAGLTINVNVQLTLPETTDASVYEKLFAAMREHLLDGMTNAA
jgi:hypothetical protein